MSGRGETHVRKSNILMLVALAHILIPSVFATQSPEFIDHLSQNVYDDCKDYDIHIKEGILLDARTKQSFTTLSKPYEQSEVKEIIELFVEAEPYMLGSLDKSGTGVMMGGGEMKNGFDILTCGSNKLDINGRDYFWNDIKVELPRTAVTNIILTGDCPSLVVGDNNTINQDCSEKTISISTGKFVLFSLGGITVVGAIINVVIIPIFKRRKDKF